MANITKYVEEAVYEGAIPDELQSEAVEYNQENTKFDKSKKQF